ncbi:MAG: glucosamine-6-phosphate deaminase [Chloroflexota bacterium]
MQEHPEPYETAKVGQLVVRVYGSRAQMGVAVAYAVAEEMRRLLSQEQVRMVFASAASQNEFLAALGLAPGLDWRRVTAFHLDEYVGLGPRVPQSFVAYLNEHLFRRVKPGVVHAWNGLAPDLEEECRRYAALYDKAPIDIVCNGIGENGHLAFNDPPFADFADPATAKAVTLDERSRQQQVHDGFYPNLAAVPRQALTLTIPAIAKARHIHCVVPGTNKAEAVFTTLSGPIAEACPASVLRRHASAVLYLDPDSAAAWRAQRG